jgi:cation diffusion facilitator family transporter
MRRRGASPGGSIVSSGGGARAIIAAFFANLGIAVAKAVGFVITGSSSMLAESIHSLADTGNQGLLVLGRRRAAKDADEVRPFGYGRERFFWAFVVALVLFSLGSLFSIYEAVHKIRHPEPIDSPLVGISIILVALVLESLSFRTAVGEANQLGRRSKGIVRFIRETRIPELPVLLLEDLGAVIGLLIALASLVLSWKVDPVFDGWGTLLIGLLLGVIAVGLAIETRSMLLGEPASPADLAAIRTAIEGSARVDRIIHLRTEHIGPEEVLVATKLAFEADLTVADLAAAIDGCEARVRAAVPHVTLIYIEPDLDRTPRDRCPTTDPRAATSGPRSVDSGGKEEG